MKKTINILLVLTFLSSSLFGRQVDYVSLTNWNLKRMAKKHYTKNRSTIALYDIKRAYNVFVVDNGMSETEFLFMIRIILRESKGDVYCVSFSNALGMFQMTRSTHKFVWTKLLKQPVKKMNHQKLFDPIYAFQIAKVYMDWFRNTNTLRRSKSAITKIHGMEYFRAMAYNQGYHGALVKAGKRVQKEAYKYATYVQSKRIRKAARRILENIKNTPLIESKIIPFDRRRFNFLEDVPMDVKLKRTKALMVKTNKIVSLRYNRKKKVWQTNDKYHTTVTNGDIRWVESCIVDY